jgi:DNA-binding SARP family transcriptional activator
MEWRVLGPLEVVDGGRQLHLGGRRSRALVAVLLLHRNRSVSNETITDALWGERPPATAAKTIQVYVSRLRKLVPEDCLLHGAGGYTLRVDEGELDVARFERLVAAADGADPAHAVQQLDEALSLFRGIPFAELEFAQAEQARIEELRLHAIEARIDARLTLGEHESVVAELEALVRDQPFSERLRAQLMLALYRSGRHTEALDVFRNVRRRLVDELGLEPGRDLQELEVRILNHDPALLPARQDPANAARIRALLDRGRERVATEMAGATELDEVRKAALALGDPETAAEAESWLGQLAWARGDQAGSFAHLERARLLTERRPPSEAKALVFDLLSRRHMTAAQYGQAIRFGREALALYTALGDDGGRVESLNTTGTARAFAGDLDGARDLEASIAIARSHDDARALARASLNLAVVLEHYGEECGRVPELEREGRAAAERAVDMPLIRAYRAREPMRALSEGRWDDAKRISDEFIAEAERTPHYEERLARMIRAVVEVGRDNLDEGIRDCRRAIQLSRAVRDPQALYLTLAWTAGILGEAGHVAEARPWAHEALDLWTENGLAYPPAGWIVGVAFVLADDPKLGIALAAAQVPTRWLDAACAIADGDVERAADIVATTGFGAAEAGLRLRAAEQLLAIGRNAEADQQLKQALAFYWRAGASLYLRRAEALMAVSA